MPHQFRRRTHLFTSESVTMGHPDKVSDQISDAILDAILTEQTKVAPLNLAATRVLGRLAAFTLACSARIASKIASLIWSETLSG